MCFLPSYLQVIITLGSIQIHNKSVARDIIVGPGDELKEFILSFCTHNYLIVQDVELKDVIEKKLVSLFLSILLNLCRQNSPLKSLDFSTSNWC